MLVNRKTQKFSLDDLTDVRTSVPATVEGAKLPNDLTADQGYNFSTAVSGGAFTAAQLKNFMKFLSCAAVNAPPETAVLKL